jgi:hypothetical protein
MSRIVRLSLTLVFAVMMVIATASAGLAFDPPNNDANDMDGFIFPALTNGPFGLVENTGPAPTECHPTMPNGGAWNATVPFGGPIAFGTPSVPGDCP